MFGIDAGINVVLRRIKIYKHIIKKLLKVPTYAVVELPIFLTYLGTPSTCVIQTSQIRQFDRFIISTIFVAKTLLLPPDLVWAMG